MNIKFTCLSTTLPNIKASLGGIQDVDQSFEIRRRSEEYVHLRDKGSSIPGIMGQIIKKLSRGFYQKTRPWFYRLESSKLLPQRKLGDWARDRACQVRGIWKAHQPLFHCNILDWSTGCHSWLTHRQNSATAGAAEIKKSLACSPKYAFLTEFKKRHFQTRLLETRSEH